MEQKSLWHVERRLTPELFDYYVARAHAERTKAIAEFYATVAAWLRRTAAVLVSRIVPASPRQPVGSVAREHRKISAT